MPFEAERQFTDEQLDRAFPEPKGRFVPFDEDRPAYNYIEADEGQDEKILFEQTGETVTAPQGTSQFYALVENESDFDEPSGVFEETAATFKKQGAYVALVANAYGLVSDESVAEFAAERSRALARAQENLPDYMKEFNRQFEEAEGFFETAGVFLSNPRAIGRTAITQAPNSILPLVTTAIGTSAGGAVAGPIGAVAGGVLGAVPGGAIVEIGAELDGMLKEKGVDITNTASVLGALQDDVFMEEIRARAQRKGITTASVDALTQIFGGRFLKASGKGFFKKGAAGAADIGVQSAGEFTGEAAGQLAREEGDFSKVNLKEAALEAVTSIAQSAGQTAIGATVGQGKKIKGKVDAVRAEKAEAAAQAPVEAPPVADVLEAAQIDIANVSEESIAGLSDAIENLHEQVPDALEQIKAQAAQEGIGGNLPVPKKPQTLSEFLKAKGGLKIDTGEAARFTKKESPQLKGVAKKTGTLSLDEARELAVEAGFLTEAEFDQETTSSVNDLLAALEDEATGVDVVRDADIDAVQTRDALIEYNEQLEQARNEVEVNAIFDTIESTFEEGVRLASEDIKAAQTAVIKTIESAKLPAKDRAKFLRFVKNIQTKEQALEKFPVLKERILRLIDEQLRSEIIATVKKSVKAAKKSKVIAADFAKSIEALVGDIDLQKRRQKTKDTLTATKEFFEKNPDQKVPRNVLKKLAILDQKSIEDVSTADLKVLLADIRNLQRQGKAKQALKEKATKRRKEKRLEELAADVKPISKTELKEASLGERLSAMDEFKNFFTNAANKARNISLALNPMDVFFDMLDGAQQYKGAASRIFKQTIDKSFSRYLNLKESVTREVKDLSDKHDLDGGNFDRIGVWAAAHQEGGRQKLRATGFTAEEIDNLHLTKEEAEVFNLMREKLDGMFPAINKVMIDVYNKNVGQVDDYFPFMTDFDAMNEFQIEDMVGENLPSPDSKRKDVAKGFTKSRVGGRNAIRVDAMAVFLQHVDNATYLIEMGRDIKELGSLAQSARYGEIAGDVGQEFTVDWLDLLARKGRAPNRIAALDTLRRNTGAAILGYKLSTVLIQPTALLDGAAFLGGNYISRGVGKIATSKEWRIFLKKNMPEIRERVGDDPNYIEMGGDSFVGKATEAGFYALKKVDLLTASSVAAGAYMKAVESKGGVVDLNTVDADAIQEAQLVLRRTQASAFAKDTPLIISAGKLTGNASLDRLIFQFQTFMLNRWSIIKHDMVAAGIGQKRTAQALNAATFLLLANMAELGLRRGGKELIELLTFQDDLEPWEETINKEAVSTLLGNVPIISNIIGSLEYGSNPVPSISLVDNILRKANLAKKSKKPDKKLKHTLGALTLGAGAVFGVPGTLQAEQIIRKLLTNDNKKGGF